MFGVKGNPKHSEGKTFSVLLKLKQENKESNAGLSTRYWALLSHL